MLSRRRDVADDLVQQTCVRALERRTQYQPGTRMDRWLFAILHSIWINELRARRLREGEGFAAAAEERVWDGAAHVETHLATQNLLRRIGDLPEAQRSSVLLAYGEGFSYAEVAAVLNIPVGTVMSRLAAARARLVSETGGRD